MEQQPIAAYHVSEVSVPGDGYPQQFNQNYPQNVMSRTQKPAK